MEQPAGPQTSTSLSAGAVVRLHVPADSAYLGLLRTTTAGVGARLDLTIDEIEDLRLAVNEAAAMLLVSAAPGAVLEVTFALAPGLLSISLQAPTGSAPPPDPSGFGWIVLRALAGSVRTDVHNGLTRIELTHGRRTTVT